MRFTRPFWVAVLNDLGLPDWKVARALGITKRQVYMSHYQWLKGDKHNEQQRQRLKNPKRKKYLREYRKQWRKDNAHVVRKTDQRYGFAKRTRWYRWISRDVTLIKMTARVWEK